MCYSESFKRGNLSASTERKLRNYCQVEIRCIAAPFLLIRIYWGYDIDRHSHPSLYWPRIELSMPLLSKGFKSSADENMDEYLHPVVYRYVKIYSFPVLEAVLPNICL